MSKNWVIAPFTFSEPETWQRVWEANLSGGFISIGWRMLGELEHLPEAEIVKRYRAKYPEEADRAAFTITKIVRKFYDEIRVGDTVVARRGRKSIAAVGRVTKTAYYDRSMASESFPRGKHFPFPNHINVDWDMETCDLTFDKTVFGMQAVHSISENDLAQLLSAQKLNGFRFADEIPEANHFEGDTTTVLVNRHERDHTARSKCLAEHGYSCSVCEMSFSKRYGKIGTNFIHVHHLTLLASRKKKHKVDPVKDLVPVCPNCHAMLHTSNPPLTIKKLKTILNKNVG